MRYVFLLGWRPEGIEKYVFSIIFKAVKDFLLRGNREKKKLVIFHIYGNSQVFGKMPKRLFLLLCRRNAL